MIFLDRSIEMPDSPATAPDGGPIPSPGHIRISSAGGQLLETRTPISIATALPNGFHPASPNQPLSPGLMNGIF